MQFIREKLTGQFEDKANGCLLSALSDAYKPVIYGATQELFKYLPVEAGSRTLRGDVFMNESNDLFYYTFSPNYNSVVAGAVCNSPKARLDYGKFRDGLSKALGEEALASSAWVDDSGFSSQFQILLEDASRLSVNEWKRKAAVVLQNPQLRAIVKLIASRPSVSLQDVAGNRDLFAVTDDVQLLEELGIITREFEIFCLETNQKVSCVSNLAALDEAAKRGFKCFHCGRTISDERIVQSLSITENGRHLAVKNMWLAYLVGAALIEEGVNPAHIVYRSEQDSDIVEVFADVEGSLFMFSVSETEITSDIAFRFLTRKNFFEPEWAYLVTPLPVCHDASTVVASGGECLEIISGIDNLSEIIRRGVAKASNKVLGDLLVSFDEMTAVGVGKWVSDYLLCPGERPTFTEVASEPEENEENLSEQNEEENIAAEEDVEDEQLMDGENDLPAVEVNYSDVGEDTENFEAEEIDSAAKAELLAEVASREPAFIVSNAEFGKVYESVLEMLPKACESNDTDEISALINSVSAMEGCSIMVATPDGLPFLGGLSTVEDSDLVAALQLDLMQNITNIVLDNGLGTLESVVIAGVESTMHMHISVDDLNVIAHQKVAEIDEIDIRHKKPNSRLKKALHGLVSLPGVNHAMVLTIEGNAVQSIGFSEDKNLAPCFAQMINEVIKGFCADISFDELRACIVCTDKASYHIMCLGDKHYLVSELGSKVPEFVWRSDIPAEASFVLASV